MNENSLFKFYSIKYKFSILDFILASILIGIAIWLFKNSSLIEMIIASFLTLSAIILYISSIFGFSSERATNWIRNAIVIPLEDSTIASSYVSSIEKPKTPDEAKKWKNESILFRRDVKNIEKIFNEERKTY